MVEILRIESFHFFGHTRRQNTPFRATWVPPFAFDDWARPSLGAPNATRCVPCHNFSPRSFSGERGKLKPATVQVKVNDSNLPANLIQIGQKNVAWQTRQELSS